MKGLVFGKTGQVGRCLAVGLRSVEGASFLDRGQADVTDDDRTPLPEP